MSEFNPVGNLITETNTHDCGKVQSVSAELIKVLEKVRLDSQAYHSQLAKNEGSTRTTLIDPVLRALGWDLSNPNSAIIEARARRGANTVSADYALSINNSINFVIEAKALGIDIKSHRNQVVDYAFAFQINNVFLTNGIIWEHFTNLNPKNLVPIRILNLETDATESVAYYLTQELCVPSVFVNETEMAKLCEKVDFLTSELETAINQICALGMTNERLSQTMSLASRIDTLKISIDNSLSKQYGFTSNDNKSNIQTQLSGSSSARAMIGFVSELLDCDSIPKTGVRYCTQDLYNLLTQVAAWQLLDRLTILNSNWHERIGGSQNVVALFDDATRAELSNASIIKVMNSMRADAFKHFDREARKELLETNWPSKIGLGRWLKRDVNLLKSFGIDLQPPFYGGSPYTIRLLPSHTALRNMVKK